MTLNPLAPIQTIIGYAMAAALALSLIANGFQWWEITRLEARLETCGQQKAEAFGRITLQNESIDGLKKQAAAADLAASAAMKKADDAEKANRGRIQARQAAIAAPAGGKTCTDALKAVREGLAP